MRLTFRGRLLGIVGISALAFAILLCSGLYLTRRMERQITEIQEHYIPFLELGPRLETDFGKLSRGFQDSVASQDKEALEHMSAVKDEFFSTLKMAEKIVSPEQIAALRSGMEDYYAAAYDVSGRIIAGETGVLLVNRMTQMQEKQSRINYLLRTSTTLDQNKLKEAFGAIGKIRVTSGRIQFFVSMFCLVIVVLLSLALSQSVLRILRELSRGLSRFGEGDFTQPIQIHRHDELGDLALEANRMAMRIKGLLKDLESFSYSVAHDLRAPLRSMAGFSNIVLEDHGDHLPPDAKESLERIVGSAKKMGQLIDGLLDLSRLNRKEIKKEQVDLSRIAQGVFDDLRRSSPDRQVTVVVAENIDVRGDTHLLQIVLTNLIGNAWKFTSKKADARIEFGVLREAHRIVYFVKDNGAGFDMQYAAKLFGTFQRLHSNDEFEGTGIGLATVHNIIGRHGGEIWAEATLGQGAAFYFTL